MRAILEDVVVPESGVLDLAVQSRSDIRISTPACALEWPPRRLGRVRPHGGNHQPGLIPFDVRRLTIKL